MIKKHSLGQFKHNFLDWLSLETPYKNLRTETGLSRGQIGQLLQISERSIRRYEDKNHAPHWYYIVLRVLCGDLSIYGARWHDCRIQPHDRKLKAPEINEPLYPVELNAMYNNHAHQARTEAHKQQIRADKAEEKIIALERLRLADQLKIEQLEARIKRLERLDNAVKSGKVVKLFKES